MEISKLTKTQQAYLKFNKEIATNGNMSAEVAQSFLIVIVG